jgi:hypothetical protein
VERVQVVVARSLRAQPFDELGRARGFTDARVPVN